MKNSRRGSSARRKSNTSVREDIAKLYNLHDYQKTCQLIDLPGVLHGPNIRRASAAVDADEESGGGLFNCKCYKKLKQKPWFKPVVKTVSFLLHFAIVLAVLGIGAMFLAKIEDPVPADNTEIPLVRVGNGTINSTKVLSNDEAFWKLLKNEFGVTIKEDKKKDFMSIISKRVAQQQAEHKQYLRNEQRKDQSFVFWKWVYFTTVACTTIGYGDVVPETDNGRFFYMIFSVFGIPLMVSLLTASGAVIKAVNKLIFRFLNKCCFKGEPMVSEHLMTIISILILFFGYVALGCVFNAALNERPLFESIYYWIVTFSTVGFGDVLQPLEDQIDWVIPLMVYRVFGLAMLAGVIDSIIDYGEYRKEELEKKRALLLRKSGRFASFRFESKKKSKTPPPRPPSIRTIDQTKIATADETSHLRALAQENGDNIFSAFASDNNRSSFHDVKTFDARVHEPIFGEGAVEDGVEADSDDDGDGDTSDDEASSDNSSSYA